MLGEIEFSSVTAQGRSAAAPGFGGVDFAAVPPDTQLEYLTLVAEDGAGSRGYLYTRGNEKTVVCFMHPRADLSKHYAMSGLLEAGFATFGQNSRWLNNDIQCIHENLLLDVAAGIRMLRDRGFEKIILCGNSGGGSLYSFYQAQAQTQPPHRQTHTPAGDLLDLNRFELPAADGLILLAAHVGQGKFLMTCIDGAVIDEDDPLSTDPALDMFNPANGFRAPPAQSSYSGEFLTRYRAAQAARVSRIDEKAKRLIEEQRYFEQVMADPAFLDQSPERQGFIARRAKVARLLTTYRTEADPAYLDLSLRPSSRALGSLIGNRPDLTNFAAGSFAGVLTPRAWLSTWSAHCSNASVLNNLPRTDCPLLIVYFTGDNGVFPSDAADMLEKSGASDKELHQVDAEHYGLPLPGKPDSDPRGEANAIIVNWLSSRF